MRDPSTCRLSAADFKNAFMLPHGPQPSITTTKILNSGEFIAATAVSAVITVGTDTDAGTDGT
jgi:hypothetical protein